MDVKQGTHRFDEAGPCFFMSEIGSDQEFADLSCKSRRCSSNFIRNRFYLDNSPSSMLRNGVGVNTLMPCVRRISWACRIGLEDRIKKNRIPAEDRGGEAAGRVVFSAAD